jgi:hypothetical protein
MMPWDPQVAIAEGNLQSIPGARHYARAYVCVCVCVGVWACVCVCALCLLQEKGREREEKKERDKEKDRSTHTHTCTYILTHIYIISGQTAGVCGVMKDCAPWLGRVDCSDG